jgi:dTDP-4-dehydrorhamnose reductase
MYQEYSFTFATRKEIDFTDKGSMEEHFRSNAYDYCINCAAYTHVDQAEKEPEKAFQINAEGVKAFAEICAERNITLLHISTDYVFDGQHKEAYTEADATQPINVYGASKLKGEQYIQALCEKHFILRTSWLYSLYEHNFLNTILKHVALGTDLKITTEQTGTPTNANDLAAVLLKIIEVKSNAYGIYHFSNEGAATWYDFAKEILEVSPQLKQAKLASINHYPTFAKRPERSVMNCKKIKEAFGVEGVDWKDSLKNLVKNIN